MTTICDTSPICYLLLIEQIEILPDLFGQVIIPPAVRDELMAEGASSPIQTWIAAPPDWLQVQAVPKLLNNLPASLGKGEQEAIALAVHLKASLIVLDDLDARQAAQFYGLTITGLLGVLYQAGKAGLLDFPEAINCLCRTSFRASPALIQKLLERYRGE